MENLNIQKNNIKYKNNIKKIIFILIRNFIFKEIKIFKF